MLCKHLLVGSVSSAERCNQLHTKFQQCWKAFSLHSHLQDAREIQLKAEVAADLRLDEPVDLTVTIGADWEMP